MGARVTPAKRLFDVVVALVGGLFALPVIGIVAAVLLIREGRPLFYVSERMKTPTQGFGLVKFRSMRVAPGADGGVTGRDKADRISPTHRVLRRTRLDELPQLWNVLRGDISLVGPRPPLRRYVEAFPDLYGRVLRSRPGITGLATLVFHAHEERLLATCETPAQTDDVYRRRCVPRKAALDLMYQRKRTLCFDLVLIWRTVWGAVRRR